MCSASAAALVGVDGFGERTGDAGGSGGGGGGTVGVGADVGADDLEVDAVTAGDDVVDAAGAVGNCFFGEFVDVLVELAAGEGVCDGGAVGFLLAFLQVVTEFVGVGAGSGGEGVDEGAALLVEEAVFGGGESDELLVLLGGEFGVERLLLQFAVLEEIFLFFRDVGRLAGPNLGVVVYDGVVSGVLFCTDVPDGAGGAGDARVGDGSVALAAGGFVLVPFFGDHLLSAAGADDVGEVAGLGGVDDEAALVAPLVDGLRHGVVGGGGVVATDEGAGADVEHESEVVCVVFFAAGAGEVEVVDALDAAAGAPEHLHAPRGAAGLELWVAEHRGSAFLGVDGTVTLVEVGDVVDVLGDAVVDGFGVCLLRHAEDFVVDEGRGGR